MHIYICVALTNKNNAKKRRLTILVGKCVYIGINYDYVFVCLFVCVLMCPFVFKIVGKPKNKISKNNFF